MKKTREGKNAVTLQTIARRVGLAPCSISAVLNDSPAARKIPQRTKNRVMQAAIKLNYRPNFSARALRTRRTHLVAVVASDLSRVEVSRVVHEIERCLREDGYLLVLGGSDPNSENDAMARVLRAGVEGVIVIDGMVEETVMVPVLHVSTCDQSGRALTEELAEVGKKAGRAMVLQIEKREGESGNRLGARRSQHTSGLTERAQAGVA
jgi:LacI family transcriptional regulator